MYAKLCLIVWKSLIVSVENDFSNLISNDDDYVDENISTIIDWSHLMVFPQFPIINSNKKFPYAFPRFFTARAFRYSLRKIAQRTTISSSATICFSFDFLAVFSLHCIFQTISLFPQVLKDFPMILNKMLLLQELQWC